jgi:hypothetical protein
MNKLVAVLIFLSFLPFVCADDDNYFIVFESTDSYSVLPGNTVVVDFTMLNRDLVYPRNVTARLDPCPSGWECESKLFSYRDEGKHAENLTIKIPENALPNKYTIYILLDSYYDTIRGDDRVVITVQTEKDANTISYDEYKAKEEARDASTPVNPAKALVNEVPKTAPAAVPVEPVAAKPVPADIPLQNKSDVVENVERLESSSQFREYVSVLLVAALVFVGIGAYVSFKKKE